MCACTCARAYMCICVYTHRQKCPLAFGASTEAHMYVLQEEARSAKALYFLGKYNVMLTIVVVSSVFDVLFRYCSDNTDMTCFNIRLVLLSVGWPFSWFLQCILTQKPAGIRYFVYSCGVEWRSLIFRIS